MQLSTIEEKIQDLPTLPVVAHKINVETKKECLTAKALARLVSKDPALAAKLLKLANSAYYGLAKQVTTIDRAITLLGFNTVRNLAVAVSVSHFFSKDTTGDLDVRGLWHHCLGTAVASRAILAQHPTLAEEAFLCGLLHDIGVIAIIHISSDEMVAVHEKIREEGGGQSEVEKEMLGFTHQFAGSLLARKWNFPEHYSAAIRFHHDPLAKAALSGDFDQRLLMAVYAGNQLAKSMRLGQSIDPAPGAILPQIWQELSLTTQDLIQLRKNIKADFDEVLSSWDLSD